MTTDCGYKAWSSCSAQQPLLRAWPSRNHARLDWLTCLIHELCGTVFDHCFDMAGFSRFSQLVILHKRVHKRVHKAVTDLREACTGKGAHVS